LIILTTTLRACHSPSSTGSLPKGPAAVIFAAPIMQLFERSRTWPRAHPPGGARNASRIHAAMARLGLILLTTAGARSLAAQGPAPHVDHFTVDDGLAQNRLQSVAQDRAGFIWLGGDRGLQRFDGYTFVQYSALDPAAPAELSGLIGDMRVDARGTLWVQASGVLFRRDAKTQRLIRVP
jgi:hypothetical protein